MSESKSNRLSTEWENHLKELTKGMRFNLNLHIEFGRLGRSASEGVAMSERSERRAEKYQAQQERRAVAAQERLRDGATLSEGFGRLRTAINKSLKEQSEDSNQEPKIGNILVCSLSETKSSITNRETGDILCVTFDAALHTVILKCENRTKLNYTVGVKPIGNGWKYVDGNGHSLGDDPKEASDYAVDKALDALLGLSE